MMFHGYGGGKIGISSMKRWLDQGYATFSMTARGFHESCGSVASRTASGDACDEGWVHLMDSRYEVRDAQTLIALLVDEGLVDGERIGATGGSYGGGMSMALAALKDRIMLPDGCLRDLGVPRTAPTSRWPPRRRRSHGSTCPTRSFPTAATSTISRTPPTSVPSSAWACRRTLWIRNLYLGGLLAPGFYAPPGADPDSDLEGWQGRLVLDGGGFDSDPEVLEIVDEISTHHSSYGIDDSVAPAPLMISSGWTDDLFPANEAVRYYNRLKTQPPGLAYLAEPRRLRPPARPVKTATSNAIGAAENAWFAHYLRGDGAEPPNQVQALTQTCPSSAPPGGPFIEDTYDELAPGEVVFERDPRRASPRPAPSTGPPSAARSAGPFPTACVTTDATDTEATANYRFARLRPAATP